MDWNLMLTIIIAIVLGSIVLTVLGLIVVLVVVAIMNRVQNAKQDKFNEKLKDLQSKFPKSFVIQNHRSDEELFWSNKLGWVNRTDATVFTLKEKMSFNLPIDGSWENA